MRVLFVIFVILLILINEVNELFFSYITKLAIIEFRQKSTVRFEAGNIN